MSDGAMTLVMFLGTLIFALMVHLFINRDVATTRSRRDKFENDLEIQRLRLEILKIKLNLLRERLRK